MTQSNNQAPSTQMTVRSVRVSGAPTGISTMEFKQVLQGRLERALAAVDASQGPARSRHIPRLALQLAAGASTAEIAVALADAIDRLSRGSSS